MMKSAPRAWTVRAVSIRLSPFTTLLVGTEKFITSVLNLFAASSKEVLVLVEGSKKRFTAVLPRRVGTFLMSLPNTSLNPAAVSRMRVISSTEISFMPSKSFCSTLYFLIQSFRVLLYPPGHLLQAELRHSHSWR